MSKKVLAFDFGGSSGRALLGTLDEGKLSYREIHRFKNGASEIDGKLRWDFEHLFKNVLEGIKLAGEFDAIGIDTWGVDYGCLDKSGNLIAQPVHYRDERTQKAFEQVHSKIDIDTFYSRTGIQPMRINTVYQLYSEFVLEKNDRVDKILFMPDLFAYMLTGNKFSERTIASTSALFDAEKNDWNYPLIKELGLPESIFAPIINSGEVYGYLKEDICKSLGVSSVPIISVCAHDTASAIMGAPTDEDSIYISCGTWSLMGVKTGLPKVDNPDFTNEYGYNYVTYLKNIMGLWLMQETKRTLEEAGKDGSFKTLDELMFASSACDSVVNPNAVEFELPCDMPKAIADYCIKTGQTPPADIGQTVACIYHSLAMSYKYAYDGLCEAFGKKYESINIIGGGSKAEPLCRLTASLIGVKVVAGPSEATAIGNLLAQLMGLGEVESLAKATEIVIKSESIKTYLPEKMKDVSKEYEKFKSLV